MIKPLPFDELNTLKQYALEDVQYTGTLSVKPKKMTDAVLDFLILAYLLGYEAVNETLGSNVKPVPEKQTEAIYKKVAGRSFDERVTEYSISGSVEEIARVAETDMTRVYNQAVIDAAKEAEKENGQRLNKVWSTMLDEKVRDTHAYLEGMSVPLDAEFYTYDGDHAQAPCGFTSAENNCGCRCQLDIVPAPIEI